MKFDSKVLIGIAACLFILLLGSGFFAVRYLGSLAEEMSNIDERILTLDLEIKNLKIFETFLRETDDERKLISQSFVSEQSLIKVVEDIEKIGVLSGAKVVTESASFVNDQKKVIPTFRISTTGGFSSVFRLMLLLENLPYELAFDEVSIIKTEGNAGSIWTGTFIIKVISYEP